MRNALRYVHQPSPLTFVFVVTLAMLLAASVLVVIGAIELLGAGGSSVLPSVERRF